MGAAGDLDGGAIHGGTARVGQAQPRLRVHQHRAGRRLGHLSLLRTRAIAAVQIGRVPTGGALAARGAGGDDQLVYQVKLTGPLAPEVASLTVTVTGKEPGAAGAVPVSWPVLVFRFSQDGMVVGA